jgi:hypothetical protein
MAHFAKLGKGNVVEQVVVVNNNEAATEQDGINFLKSLYGQDTTWVQTSYNTHGGEHKLGETPLRKNFAQIDGKYNESLDAFIPPKPYASWLLNNDTCLWDAPVAKPDDYGDPGVVYVWSEGLRNWQKIE